MDKKVNSYAEALFLLAQEENSTQEYLTALYDIGAVFKENPEYSDFLSSYTISKEKRIEALETAFGEAINERVISFMCILIEKRKVHELEEIISEFERMYFEAENISKAYITSACELDKEQSEKIAAKLEKICGHKVIVEYLVDSALLGGMKIEVDGRIIDSSVRNRLNKLREVMDK